ncbi:MAG: hypothetical protein HKN48_02710 [Flavobacteriaceae bacterium]|nr:hypothetical protein [Flavobacteriaceae bacterium]
MLKQLKLLDQFRFESSLDKETFVSRLKENVDFGEVGFTSEAFEQFEARTNWFKGTVSSEAFVIKKRRGPFDVHLSKAVAKGTFQQKENTLFIDTTINSFRTRMYLYYGFLCLLLMAILWLGFLASSEIKLAPVAITSAAISLVLLAIIPYFLMVKSTARLKRELLLLFHKISKHE